MHSENVQVKHPDLDKAQAFALRTGVSIPNTTDLAALGEGDCVKVGVGLDGVGSEAFWVELLAIGPPQMFGVIVNQLKFTARHNLAAGDVIMIERDDVLAITK
ncbi:hypothetical protein SJI00_21325 [Pseudomonas sp. RP23018S]|uniref:hypothetical protein n=1 Tax=Pseudomonas sp. RP23018S TaxID=3096037 RepID=UPI002AC9F424|nr:hypothetical protein [Pseudomonas sp. RP23018S]MDZ5605320.1 hypothetical protein [Pseudomonas sp. RP23018S]